MTDRYILDSDGFARPEPDLFAWARWFETADRHLAQDLLAGNVRVSTVFLGLDHNFSIAALTGQPHAPILWETMIFGGEHDGYQDRYGSREEALVGHRKALALAKGESEAR